MGYDSKEAKKVRKLLSLCCDGVSSDILAWVKKCGYDRHFLMSHIYFFIHGPVIGHAEMSFLDNACSEHNLSAVVALLELGANPNNKYYLNRGSGDGKKISIMKKYSTDEDLSELLSNGLFWWQKTYSKQRSLSLQDEFKTCIRNKDYCYIIWHLIRGLRLDNPDILTEDAFNSLPRIMKDMVCRMGIPRDKTKAFLGWLRHYASCKDTLSSLESAASRNHDVMDTALENIRLSLDLMEYDKLFHVVQSTLPKEEQVLLLKWLAERYDMTGNKETLYNIFMETLKNILYSLVS
jgi:hypothetical protein